MLLNIDETYSLNREQRRVLNEVYIGKTKELLAIERELDLFRNAHMERYFEPMINSDPQLLKINRMFEKAFGFGCFTLEIINQMQINACTMSIDYKYDVKSFGKEKDVIVDKTGYKFNPAYDYAGIVMIYSGLIFNPNYTTEEIMAVILHEIGHNFFSTIDGTNGLFILLVKTLVLISALQSNIFSLLYMFNGVDSLLVKLDRNLREKNSIIVTVLDYYSFFTDLLAQAKTTIFGILNVLTFNLFKTVLYAFVGAIKIYSMSNPLNILLTMGKYKNERTADNFPSIYGYGPALTSAVNKFEAHGYSPSKMMNAIENTPVISTIYNMISLPAEILVTAFDEHPAGIARAQDQLDLLNEELKKSDLDPKMKKVIKSDIILIEKQMQKIIDNSKGMQDPDLARHCYNRWLYEKTGSKEIKDILLSDKRRFYEYDRVFYDRLGK